MRKFTFLNCGGAPVEGEGIATGHGPFQAAAKALPAKLELPGNWHYARAALESAAKDGRFVCYGPAGGGYGNPLERDQADDVLDEVISALRGYGVMVSTKSVVNLVATEKARAGRIA